MKNNLNNPASSRIEAIDGLRATAMLMVYAYHVWQNSGSPNLSIAGNSFDLSDIIKHFPAGVDLFMVISGFCLFWPYAKSPQRLETWDKREYFKRRFRRICPPYYMAILYVTILPNLLVLAYLALGKEASWQSIDALPHYITHLTFTHTFFPEHWSSIQGVFWSLGLEMQFYLVFPFVLWSFRRFGMKTIVGMCLISFIYRIIGSYFVSDQPWPIGFLYSITFLGRWMQFAAGMYAAWYVANRRQHHQPLNAATGTCLLIAALAFYTLAVKPMNFETYGFPLRATFLAIAYATALISLCASTSPIRILFENKAITTLGFMSYSIFLIHQNTAFYISEFLEKNLNIHGPTEFIILCTLGFAIIIAISYVFFRLFEAPFLNVKKTPPTPST